MKSISIIFFLSLACTSLFSLLWSQPSTKLDRELDRLNTDFALIVPSHSILQYPLWSENSDYIAGNVGGQWVKINLKAVSLIGGYWKSNLPIGVMKFQDNMSLALSPEIAAWKKINTMKAHEITTQSKIKIELKQNNYDTTLIVTKNTPEVLWSKSSENCHSLVLSHDEKYLAFVCDHNGIIIMRLKKWQQ